MQKPELKRALSIIFQTTKEEAVKMDTFLAFTLPVCAVISFTLALLICDGEFLKDWKYLGWFYKATTDYPLVRAILVCAVFSAAGSVMAADAFTINASIAAPVIAASTMVSHIFIAQFFDRKAMTFEIVVLAFVLIGLIAYFGIELNKLPSKDQEKVNASAEKAITLQATSE